MFLTVTPLTTLVSVEIQAYSAGVCAGQGRTGGLAGKRSSGRGRGAGGGFQNCPPDKRGIDPTRSCGVINERDSQDFTGAKVVFVKRSRYRHRRPWWKYPRARSVGASAPAPLERFAVTVISPFGSLISAPRLTGQPAAEVAE